MYGYIPHSMVSFVRVLDRAFISQSKTRRWKQEGGVQLQQRPHRLHGIRRRRHLQRVQQTSGTISLPSLKLYQFPNFSMNLG